MQAHSMNSQVKAERTYWRDGHLSQRHRLWGIGVPAYDIDFILMEVDRAEVRALIEYKAEHAQPQFETHPSYRALGSLGNAARVPVFAVRYAQNFTWFKLIAINDVAKQMFPRRQEMNERQYVSWLYHLRGLQPPKEIFQALETAI